MLTYEDIKEADRKFKALSVVREVLSFVREQPEDEVCIIVRPVNKRYPESQVAIEKDAFQDSLAFVESRLADGLKQKGIAA